MKYYLVTVEGVEPFLHGPIKKDRVHNEASELNKTLDPDDMIFLLKIGKSGKPEINSFSGSFFSDDDEERR